MGGESSQEVSPLWCRIASFRRAESFHERLPIITFDVVTTSDCIAALRNIAAHFLGKSKTTAVRNKVRKNNVLSSL